MVRLDLAVVTLTVLLGPVSGSALNVLEEKGRVQLDVLLAESKTCTKDRLMIRREWGDVPADERRAYIAAVLCLMESPSKLDPEQYPGAKARYDDFVAVHINQTLAIHNTVSLVCHFAGRQSFVVTCELGKFLVVASILHLGVRKCPPYRMWIQRNATGTSCLVQGAGRETPLTPMQYWDWGKWAEDPESSPIFDGSDTSLGGNGERINHGPQTFAPAGNGGGCVLTGPFKNMTVRLGPVSPDCDPPPPSNPRDDGFGYNPRCLRRDLSNYLPMTYGTTDLIVALITNNTDILSFQWEMEAMPPHGTMGVHGMGHFTISGDPAGDFYSAAGDPAFFVHHSMIDRTWTIWQNQDLDNRLMAMEGPTQMLGGGGHQSLDDIVDLGVLVERNYRIRDLMSTVDGPFCYAYE
jgi:tyrosinase